MRFLVSDWLSEKLRRVLFIPLSLQIQVCAEPE